MRRSALRFGAAISTVGLKPASLGVVGKRILQDFLPDAAALLLIFYGESNFHAAIHIPMHQISTAEIHLVRTAVFEQKRARVFEESSNDARHAYILAESRHAGAKTTHPTNDERDQHTCG